MVSVDDNGIDFDGSKLLRGREYFSRLFLKIYCFSWISRRPRRYGQRELRVAMIYILGAQSTWTGRDDDDAADIDKVMSTISYVRTYAMQAETTYRTRIYSDHGADRIQSF